MAKARYAPTLQDNLRAYQRVLEAIDTGKVDRDLMANTTVGCTYSAMRKGKEINCGVGCLFTPAQLADIKRRKLNSYTGVAELAEKIGKANIQMVTGLTVEQATTLQRQHDRGTSRKFRTYVLTRISQVSNDLAMRTTALAS